uniref:Uncharacterized protein n=1 Tax=Anopheles arabiensis TaxID=7173 RepID=A0A182IF51_ANOAR
MQYSILSHGTWLRRLSLKPAVKKRKKPKLKQNREEKKNAYRYEKKAKREKIYTYKQIKTTTDESM